MKIGSLDTKKKVVLVAELSANHKQDLNLAKETIEAAKEAGADLVAAPCPLCHKAMDGNEEPVLQVTQLINVACGATPEEAHWDLNKTEVKISIG